MGSRSGVGSGVGTNNLSGVTLGVDFLLSMYIVRIAKKKTLEYLSFFVVNCGSHGL
jgi:hypothetical protein